MSSPLITIGITCYNAEDSIARVIDGALNQDYPNFEIIIVDDCSCDNSLKELQRYEESFSDKFRIYKNDTNLGVARSRNRLIAEARGEFLAFFDDDDDSSPSRLSMQYRRILVSEQELKTNNIICFGSGKKIYPNGYVVRFKAIGSEPRIPSGDDVVRYHLFMDRPSGVFYGSGTPSCSMMARKSVFLSVGGFDANFRRIEDSDLCVRLGLSGTYFVGCPEEVVIQHASEGSDKNPQAGYGAEVLLIEKYKDYLTSHHRYDYAKDWTLVRFYHFAGKRRQAILQTINMALKYPFLTLKRFIKAAPRRLIHESKMKHNNG